MAEEHEPPERDVPPPEYDIAYTDGEKTAVGRESEARDEPVVVLAERHHLHHVQNTALRGLLVLLGEVLLLGIAAMIGVASRSFDPAFALQVLAITLTPSFTAWLIVVRWAFRKEGDRGG